MDSSGGKKRFEEEIGEQASWIRKWRKKGIFWEKVLTVGAIGWMVVLPMVIGGYLGNYLDESVGRVGGGVSWTVTCIVLGLFVAVYSVWRVYLRRP